MAGSLKVTAYSSNK